MKGKLIKKENLWYVTQSKEQYPLSPDDELKIREWNQIFDNLEARLVEQEVEFEIEDFWETGLEEVIKVAKLK